MVRMQVGAIFEGRARDVKRPVSTYLTLWRETSVSLGQVPLAPGIARRAAREDD